MLLKGMGVLRSNALWLAGVLLSVGITFFSYPPHGLGLLMFVGLVPVFLAMETAPTWKAAAFRTWLYVFLGNAAICSWVAYSVHEFTKLPWLLSYPAVFVLSVAEQGSWPLLAGLRHHVHRKLGVRPLFWTPAALLFLDVCWPKFFPNTMGNVFYDVPWLRQVADVTGVWGLTALLGMTNELGALAVLHFARSERAWNRRELKKHAIASAALLAVAFAYGAWRLAQVREAMTHPKDHLRVALVQPNVNGPMKVRSEVDKDYARAQVLSRMLRLTDDALKLNPELVFWPETAYPDTYHSQSYAESFEVTEALDRYLASHELQLLFGGRDRRGEARYNSLFLVKSQGGRLKRQTYHKTVLLELAEHTPGAEFIPGLAELARENGGTNYAIGSGPTLFEGPRGTKLGVMICLEGLYARFVRRIASLGADVLVNATNDSWFGESMEPELHLYLTTFRAIETRRPLVRATNTGHSVVVDIDGSLRLKTGLFEETVVADDVPIYEGLGSPYLWLGDTLIVLAGLYAAWPLLRAFLSRRRRKSR